jgi:phage shock protein PspC (stress-responsive transcriptional regulator)
MNIMGKPEDFAGDDAQSSSASQQESNYYQGNRRRRIFRDPDSKVLGGVCAGFANYFDFDAIWIRIALVVLVLMSFGVLIPFYIILWIIIPEARTTAEKLEMRGEAIDINNISKTVKEEAQQFKQRMDKYRAGDRLADFLKQFFRILFKVFVKLIGLIFLFIGIGLMIGTIAIMLNKATIDGTDAQLYVDDFLGTNKFMMVFGLVLLLGVPAIMLLYKGFKMLFGIKFHNKWLNISSGVLWTIGLIILICAVADRSKEFKSDGNAKNNFVLKNAKQDTLYISVDLKTKLLEQFETYREERHMGKIRIGGFRNGSIQKINEEIYGAVQVNVVESESDSFEINIIKRASGPEKRVALERARKINYSISQNDSLIIVDPLFKLEKGEKLRGQNVTVMIGVPKGKVVKLDKSLYSFLHDVDNVTNTWDGDMVDRRWKMTARGLQCIDCENLDMNDSDFDLDIDLPEPPSPPVPPGTTPGIHINDKDAKVIMDEKGIDIKSKEVQIKMDKDGINIKTNDNKKKEVHIN